MDVGGAAIMPGHTAAIQKFNYTGQKNWAASTNFLYLNLTQVEDAQILESNFFIKLDIFFIQFDDNSWEKFRLLSFILTIKRCI